MLCNSLSLPFILQAIVLLPIFVCTAYAKSIGVASFGNFITEPFGVKQKHFLETFEVLCTQKNLVGFHFDQ